MAQNALRSGRAACGVSASIVYVASESYSFVVTSMSAAGRGGVVKMPRSGRILQTLPTSA